ncbi:hypothetical protein ABPG77_000702 [Micractinium sp. CCAP 211/92]
MSGSGPLREDSVHDAKSNALHAMAQRIGKHFPQVPSISSTELRRIHDTGAPGLPQVVVVDCRTPEETAVSMIPGSLTQAEFEARRGEMAGKTVVCYCTVGYRSSSLAAKLRGQGLEAKNLEGGIVRWAQKRYPLVARNGEGKEEDTKRIHVYAKPWALQPDDYEAVMFASPFVSWPALPGAKMSKRELAALEALNVKRGDVVRTAFRGGVRQGPVQDIQKDPPKVVFSRRRKGQPDKQVKHNPSTLEKVTPDTREEGPELNKSRASASAKKRSTEASGSKATGGAGKRSRGEGKGKAAEPPSPKGGRVSKLQGGNKAAPPSPKTPTKAAAPKRAGGRRSGGGRSTGQGAGSRHAARGGVKRARAGGRRG